MKLLKETFKRELSNLIEKEVSIEVESFLNESFLKEINLLKNTQFISLSDKERELIKKIHRQLLYFETYKKVNPYAKKTDDIYYIEIFFNIYSKFLKLIISYMKQSVSGTANPNVKPITIKTVKKYYSKLTVHKTPETQQDYQSSFIPVFLDKWMKIAEMFEDEVLNNDYQMLNYLYTVIVNTYFEITNILQYKTFKPKSRKLI